MLLSKEFAGSSLSSGVSGVKQSSTSSARLTSLTIQAAHKKGGGSTKNGRDSNAQRRGVKVFGGQPVKAGGIIIRQTGSTVHPGDNVAAGKDYTLYALQEGIVVFKKNKYIKQVTVVNAEDYKVPEGQQPKQGGRKDRRKEQYAGARRKKESKTVAAAAVVAP